MDPPRVMLDSNAYDEILKRPWLREKLNKLARKMQLTFVGTHIEEDELADTPDTKHRADLIDVYDELISTRIPTGGALWGKSRWGLARFGDGTGEIKIADIRKGSTTRHAEDALIAITASSVADILVTNDKDLTTSIRAKEPRLRVLDFDEFVKFVGALE